MPRMYLLGVLFLLGSLSTRAQALDPGPFQTFAGYSYTRFDTSPVTTSSTSFNGVEVTGQYRFRNWLSGVADFGGSVGTLGIPPSLVTYLFGPEVSFPARVSPFAHVLIGGAHFGPGTPVPTLRLRQRSEEASTCALATDSTGT